MKTNKTQCEGYTQRVASEWKVKHWEGEDYIITGFGLHHPSTFRKSEAERICAILKLATPLIINAAQPIQPPPETGAVDVEKLIAEIYRTQNSSPQHLLAKRLTIVIQLAIDPLTARISELEGTLETVTKGSFEASQAMAAVNAELRARVKEMEANLEGALKLTTASSIEHVSKLER